MAVYSFFVLLTRCHHLHLHCQSKNNKNYQESSKISAFCFGTAGSYHSLLAKLTVDVDLSQPSGSEVISALYGQRTVLSLIRFPETSLRKKGKRKNYLGHLLPSLQLVSFSQTARSSPFTHSHIRNRVIGSLLRCRAI
jgi:hypothetical protein